MKLMINKHFFASSKLLQSLNPFSAPPFF
ncbi:Hypothetical Protein MfeM64YM_0258 [Mycoplasmopsis fermentans M64]|uniref:Uncharacterized protein n=1 Tax=Mycoplasmopsis fermentans (strain M64) TaxID=943945 RepID=A0AB32XAT7_MYCFM|nr:Hypothetical Protein MfeM64YM_0258 [Mycoplasmopsis fermentans M64]